MKGVHLHEVSDKRIIVEMVGTGEDMLAIFDKLIKTGARLYHPIEVEDRYTDKLFDYPDDDLEPVDLEARREQVAFYADYPRLTMVYVTRSIDDAVLVKMGM